MRACGACDPGLGPAHPGLPPLLAESDPVLALDLQSDAVRSVSLRMAAGIATVSSRSVLRSVLGLNGSPDRASLDGMAKSLAHASVRPDLETRKRTLQDAEGDAAAELESVREATQRSVKRAKTLGQAAKAKAAADAQVFAAASLQTTQIPFNPALFGSNVPNPNPHVANPNPHVANPNPHVANPNPNVNPNVNTSSSMLS